MKAWKLLMIFLTVGSLLLVGGCDGCGDDDDDDDDDGYNPEAPYGPPTRTTQYSFSRPAYGTSMSYAIVSEKEIGGETYWMANIGDPNQTNGLPMNEIYLRFDDPPAR
ncbi:MAG: hypothetical protein M5R36_14695 [Deltaproteobacteria bacterium]|nr:hypothetical protein [Deltaproteobacteria bacterium]